MGKTLTDAEKAEMYRKQLGGTNAALNRERQKVFDLQVRISDLTSENNHLKQIINDLRGEEGAWI